MWDSNKIIYFLLNILKLYNGILVDDEDGGVLGHLYLLKSILMRKD